MAEHLMLDLVLRRIRHSAVRQYLVKEALEARLRIADDALAPREGRNGRSSLIAMKVDDQVKMTLTKLTDKAQKC